MAWLTKCWNWFWRQSLLSKVAILGLFAAFVPFVLPTVVNWFRPTMIHVGVSFYTYERGIQPQGMNTLYFFERRNLVSDCSIRREEQSVPNGRAKVPDPHAWVLLKLLLENVSDRDITNLQVGVRSPAINQSTQLLTAQNLVITGQKEAPPNVKPLYVLSITTLPRESSVVVTLKTPIDDNLREFIYVKRRPVTIQVPYVSADQFRQYPPIVSRTNVVKMLNREGVLRTSDETFAEEKLQVTILSPNEPSVKEGAASYRTLPRAKACSEAEAGVW
ncbi:MAG: hypothetical protein OEV27_14260 [Nitrospira sp.]|nr:hypothetical protein [Nitrospira sp.]MDH4252341.1 hypothetical protein [Nitrospira sp.]MDH4344447.1 hypothetical protein [Nitrospira sp.]MDH5337813.1 hypothetical protein [Nitrospira sp.]